MLGSQLPNLYTFITSSLLSVLEVLALHPSLLLLGHLHHHHRLRGSASPVLTATGFVNGKGQFSTPHRIDTPQPITKKFVTGDYVGDPYGCAKLGAYPYTGGFWAHG